MDTFYLFAETAPAGVMGTYAYEATSADAAMAHFAKTACAGAGDCKLTVFTNDWSRLASSRSSAWGTNGAPDDGTRRIGRLESSSALTASALGGFFELPDGQIACIHGWNRQTGAISYSFDGDRYQKVGPDAQVDKWKARPDLSSFPPAAPSPCYAPIGAADVVGAGLGWVIVAYRAPDGQTVGAESSKDGRIARWRPIPESAPICPLPGVEIPNGVLGAPFIAAFALRDGRVICGTEGELMPQFRRLLSDSPSLLGDLTAIGVARRVGDPILLEEAVRRGAAYMDGRGAAFWRSTQLCDAYRDAIAAAFPEIAGDRWYGPARDVWIHVEDGRAWVVLPGPLWAIAGENGVRDASAEAVARGLDIAVVGFADGGCHPHRWRPDEPPVPGPKP